MAPILSIVLFALFPAFAQTPKIQTLIVTGQNGHDWRETTPLLRQILEETGRFEVHVTEEFRCAGTETLAYTATYIRSRAGWRLVAWQSTIGAPLREALPAESLMRPNPALQLRYRVRALPLPPGLVQLYV